MMMLPPWLLIHEYRLKKIKINWINYKSLLQNNKTN